MRPGSAQFVHVPALVTDHRSCPRLWRTPVCRTLKTPAVVSAGCSMQTPQRHLPASRTGAQVSGRPAGHRRAYRRTPLHRSRLTAPLPTSARCFPRSMAIGPTCVPMQAAASPRRGVTERLESRCRVCTLSATPATEALLERDPDCAFHHRAGRHGKSHAVPRRSGQRRYPAQCLRGAAGPPMAGRRGPHCRGRAGHRPRSPGWICGNPLGVESPGLMTGISGIGYALLRLADPVPRPIDSGARVRAVRRGFLR